jgi:glycosyltransferase involved in cell wall biosynthesis
VSVYRSEINHGPYKGLNKLIDHARGEYIAIQDHDDIWHPKKIEIQTEFLENNPKYIGCGGLPLKFFEKEYKIAKVSWPREDYCAPHPSLVFRNDGQKYAEDITYKGDVYFMRHTLCNGKKNIYNIQQPLYLSRVRADETNLSENWTDSENIKDYYTKSGELRYLILYLAYKYLPKRLVEPLRKKISRDWEYKDLNHLANSEFTKPYLRYLESDHSDM